MAGEQADAIATIKSAVIDAFTERCQLTGMRAGPAADILLDNILKALTAPDIRWALGVLSQISGEPRITG
jgi:hypothetical protein